MLLQHLESLRAHGEWADARLVNAMQAASGDFTNVLRELGHIRGAQEIWLSRIEGRPSTMSVWPHLSAEELLVAGAALDAQLRAMLAELTPETITRIVEYTNLAGARHSTPLDEILLHVLMHGHYHRGKANAALRDAGVAPVDVDYIFWKWRKH